MRFVISLSVLTVMIAAVSASQSEPQIPRGFAALFEDRTSNG